MIKRYQIRPIQRTTNISSHQIHHIQKLLRLKHSYFCLRCTALNSAVRAAALMRLLSSFCKRRALSSLICVVLCGEEKSGVM